MYVRKRIILSMPPANVSSQNFRHNIIIIIIIHVVWLILAIRESFICEMPIQWNRIPGSNPDPHTPCIRHGRVNRKAQTPPPSPPHAGIWAGYIVSRADIAN